MDNNELLMIVLAFVVGYMCSGMMKQMCGGRLVEGWTLIGHIIPDGWIGTQTLDNDAKCWSDYQCKSDYCNWGKRKYVTDKDTGVSDYIYGFCDDFW